jgi:hypothetical protein
MTADRQPSPTRAHQPAAPSPAGGPKGQDLKDVPVRDVGAAIPRGAPPRIPWSEPPRAGGSGPRIVHRAVDPVGGTGSSDMVLRRPDEAPRGSNCWTLVRRVDLVPRWARCYTWGNRPADGLAAPVLSAGARWAVDLLFTGETVQLDARTGKVVRRVSYPGRAQAVAAEDRDHYLVVVTRETSPDAFPVEEWIVRCDVGGSCERATDIVLVRAYATLGFVRPRH